MPIQVPSWVPGWFVSGGSANLAHCWNKFSPARSKGCPFRFQVGFQVGLFRADLQTYHTVEINFHLPGPRVPIQVPSWVPGWFVSGGSANLPHCWNKFSPTRSEGCPLRFQVGFQVGLFAGERGVPFFFSSSLFSSMNSLLFLTRFTLPFVLCLLHWSISAVVSGGAFYLLFSPL